MRLLRGLAAGLILLASPVGASEATDRLYEALRIPALLDVMREEGVQMAEDLAAEYLGGAPDSAWIATTKRIYDADRMDRLMREAFATDLEGLDEAGIDRLTEFFDSPRGREITQLELEARREFLADEVQEQAQAAVDSASVRDATRLSLIDAYIEVNDLIDRNVTGALNANFNFYLGLIDGGLVDMSESEVIAEVWSQEEETRAQSRDWLRSYLYFAYAPLSEADLVAYTELSTEPAGQRLNGAIFAGFGRLYDDIYHSLGRAVAYHLSAQEL